MLSFGAGWMFFASTIEEYPYNNGPLVLFSCYNSHTHEKRTFEYISKCPKCGQYAGQTRFCPKCKRNFAISEWPHKDMTDKECIDFQKKLHVCPYCKYTRTIWLSLRQLSKHSRNKLKNNCLLFDVWHLYYNFPVVDFF